MEHRELDLFLELSIRRNYPVQALCKNQQEYFAVLTLFIAGLKNPKHPTQKEAETFLNGPASWLKARPEDLLRSDYCLLEIPSFSMSYQELHIRVQKRQQLEVEKRRERALWGERRYQESQLDLSRDEFWMKEALLEAEVALQKEEIPVGAVIVMNDRILGRGHNQVIETNDPTAHAEIQAIRNATHKLGNYRLDSCTLYVTLEPCPMCAGAILHSRIKRVVYGASAGEESRVCGSANLLKPRNHRDKPYIRSGVLSTECQEFLDYFFRCHRKSEGEQ